MTTVMVRSSGFLELALQHKTPDPVVVKVRPKRSVARITIGLSDLWSFSK